MARVVIEGFPDELHKELKLEAVAKGSNVKALIIAALQERPKQGAKQVRATIQAFAPRSPEQKGAKP